VATWLGVVTGNPIASAGYLIAVSVIALPIIFRFLPETKGRDLSSDDMPDVSTPSRVVAAQYRPSR
jgi:MHS family proline/betaine transporter-like MFS transporter